MKFVLCNKENVQEWLPLIIDAVLFIINLVVIILI